MTDRQHEALMWFLEWISAQHEGGKGDYLRHPV